MSWQAELRMERNRWIYDLIWCAECGAHVPVFHDLAPPEAKLLETWCRKVHAYWRIAAITGLDKGLVKMWQLHFNKPIARTGKWITAACPHCERWLRGPDAKQCFHCGADWHDDVRRLA